MKENHFHTCQNFNFCLQIQELGQFQLRWMFGVKVLVGSQKSGDCGQLWQPGNGDSSRLCRISLSNTLMRVHSDSAHSPSPQGGGKKAKKNLHSAENIGSVSLNLPTVIHFHMEELSKHVWSWGKKRSFLCEGRCVLIGRSRPVQAFYF